MRNPTKKFVVVTIVGGMVVVINVSVPCCEITPGAIANTTASVGEPSPFGSLQNTAVEARPSRVGSGKAGVPQAIEIEVMTLLPPVTGNELQATKLPPFVRPIESSAVPSSIMYVNRGILPSIDRNADLTVASLSIRLVFGSFGAGARKALAGASVPFESTRPDFLAADAFCFVFRCASAKGIAQTATSRSR